MANTYTQLYIQFVFVVKFRQALITTSWEDRLHKYIIAIVQNNGHKVLAINSASDHVHLFIGLNPNQSISDLMRQVKHESSQFINEHKLTKTLFRWQEGYGAFSYSQSQIQTVIRYIERQKEHHKKVTFRDEYLKLLNAFEIDYNEKYIFKELE